METQPAQSAIATQERIELEPSGIPPEFTVVIEALHAALRSGSRDQEIARVYDDAAALGVPAREVRILHMFARAND
jgi:hypothetical protein